MLQTIREDISYIAVEHIIMQYRTTSFQINYPDWFTGNEQAVDEASINQLGLRVTFTSQDGKAQVKISTQHFEMMQALGLSQGWSAESFAGPKYNMNQAQTHSTISTTLILETYLSQGYLRSWLPQKDINLNTHLLIPN
jgi:hypothetical protein